jgi:trehalose-6-phosphatase
MFQLVVEFLPLMEKVARTLEYSVNAIDGAAVVNNKFCVMAHYCNFNPKVDIEIKLNLCYTIPQFPDEKNTI